MTKDEEDTWCAAVWTILKEGSGTLVTDHGDVTRLIRHEDGYAVLVPPERLQLLIDRGMIEPHSVN